MHKNIKYQHEGESELPALADVMSREPGNRTISHQSAFHYLINIDEFPELLPLSNKIVSEAINASKDARKIFPDNIYEENGDLTSFTKLSEQLEKFSNSLDYAALIENASDTMDKEHLMRQLSPTILASGSWLQNLSRVATAHTSVAGRLNKLFYMHTMAYEAAEVQHANRIESDITNLFTMFRKSRLSNDYSFSKDAESYPFELPLLLLSIGQFPRTFLPELLGLNLAWHFLGIQAFIEQTALESFLGSSLTAALQDAIRQRNNTMSELSLEAVEIFHDEQDLNSQVSVRRRILCGMEMLAGLWEKLLNDTNSSMPIREPDPRAEMVELMRSKGPHALGYHRDKKLDPQRIDNLLNIEEFDPSEVVDSLANSPFIVTGDAANSPFATGLLEIGGPMAAVFSEDELIVVRNWINSLDKAKDNQGNNVQEATSISNLNTTDLYPLWERPGFLEESCEEYASRPCSLREIFYKLVNIEYFPEILPVAEQFLIDRLNRSRSTLTTGERPIPDLNYSYHTLEEWVFNKHRQQVDAYQPFSGTPRVSKETFINATVALAPLLLIDGGWLQGTTSINTIHTPVGQKLYHIFYEEIGLGSADLHHSNIYRELLESMGVDLPDVTDLDFAFSDQFPDSAFEVPILWLSLSCFTRHYYPELLGINLAVELAGLGASYMEAHDILKHYDLPTIFVDFHNSADNVSVGHTAWSLEAIKMYMNSIAEQEGPHNLDAYWQRIWSGMRLTLPATSDFHWNPTHHPVQTGKQMTHSALDTIF